MLNNSAIQGISLLNFPEKISVKEVSGKKVQIYFYGPKSYDNQLAAITHYLHNKDTIKLKKDSRQSAVKYLKEYISYKYCTA